MIEDHREQIFALEAAQDAALIGNGHRGIRVVDEQHVDRRIGVLRQRAAEVIHVHGARAGFGRRDPRPVDAPRRRVAHRVATAPHPELSADRGQRQDRHRRVAAVAIALVAPAAAHERRRARRVQLSDAFERVGINAGHVRRARDRPFFRALAQPVRAVRVLAQERLVGMTVGEEIPMDG